jgi:hypothetical protein
MSSLPGTGGLPARRLDQQYSTPAAGVQAGSSAGIFRGRLVVVSGTSTNGSNGIFVYSGTPGAGNLIVSIAAVAGTDQYGNAYPAGLNVTVGSISGSSLILAGLTEGVFLYSPAAGAGTLAGWFTSSAGTDAYGNTYTAGFNIGGTSGSNVSIVPNQNQPFNITTAISGVLQAVMQMSTADADQLFPGFLGSLELGSGTTAKQAVVLSSPMPAGPGTGAVIVLEAQDDGATDNPVITFGSVSTPDLDTLVFTPWMTLGPYYFLMYSGASGQTTVTKTSGSGNIPIPAGVSVGKGECWAPGGGGGGGFGGGENIGNSAGSGGEYARESALVLTPGGNAAYVVGPGGAGGPNGTSGSNGSGQSTLQGTSVQVVANPGQGGVQGVLQPGGEGSTNSFAAAGGAGNDNVALGGAGGGSSGGPGGTGNEGGNAPGGGSHAGGPGGEAVAGGGSGGNGGGATQSGFAGTAPGGGGGGGGNGSLSTGGGGANGQVRLTYSTGAPAIVFSIAAGGGTDQFGTGFSAGMNYTGNTNWANSAVPSAPGNGAKLFATGGQLEYVSQDTNLYQTGVKTIRLTGTMLVASTTPLTITDGTNSFSFPVAAASYRFRCLIMYQGTAAAGSPGIFGLSGTATATNYAYMFSELGGNAVAGSAATVSYGFHNTGYPGLALPGLATLVSGDLYSMTVDGIFTFTGVGTFTCQASATANADTYTVAAGSYMTLEPVT